MRLILLLLLALALVLAEEDEEDDDCGELCQYLLGVATELMARYLLGPSLEFMLASQHSVVFGAGVLVAMLLLVGAILAVCERIAEYRDATSDRARYRMAQKDASFAAGVYVSHHTL